MVARLRRSVVLLLAAAAPVWAQPAAPHSDAALERELRRRTQELMDAVAPGKKEVWEKYLHPRHLSLDENGTVYDKAAIVAEIQPLPAGLVGRIEVDKFRLERKGDTAVVVAEVQEYLDYHGQQLRTRFRFLDTWLREAGDWLLLARHTAAVLKDPPAIPLTVAELGEYAGRYRLTAEIATTLRVATEGEAGLVSERTGRPAVNYRPEVKDLFFAPGQPRSRRLFERDAQGRVVAFRDRREGEDIRWVREP